MNEKQMHRDATLKQLAKTVASLQSFEYDTFDEYLCQFLEEDRSSDDMKAREEYAVLFDLSSHYKELRSTKILKIERPDFVLGNSGKIGIEVTRLTTESESGVRRISRVAM